MVTALVPAYIIDTEETVFTKAYVIKPGGKFLVGFIIGGGKGVVAYNEVPLQGIKQWNFVHDVAFEIMLGMQLYITIVSAVGVVRQHVEYVKVAVTIAHVGLITVKMLVIGKRDTIGIKEFAGL